MLVIWSREQVARCTFSSLLLFQLLLFYHKGFRDSILKRGKQKSGAVYPAGAALLKHFVSRFGDMPVITVQAIGCGMGTKEFDAANCIQVFWGDAAEG